MKKVILIFSMLLLVSCGKDQLSSTEMNQEASLSLSTSNDLKSECESHKQKCYNVYSYIRGATSAQRAQYSGKCQNPFIALCSNPSSSSMNCVSSCETHFSGFDEYLSCVSNCY